MLLIKEQINILHLGLADCSAALVQETGACYTVSLFLCVSKKHWLILLYHHVIILVVF